MISWCHSVEPILENTFLEISTSLVHDRKTLNHHANSENMGSLETSGTTIFGRFWPHTWRLSIVWATSWLFSGSPSSHCLWRLLSGSMAKTAPGTPYYVGILHSHCMACRMIFTQKLYLVTLKVVWGPQLRSFSQQPSQNEHGTHGNLHWDNKWKTMKLFCGLFFGSNMGHFQSKLLTSKVWRLVDSMPFEPTWRSSCIFSFVYPLVIFNQWSNMAGWKIYEQNGSFDPKITYKFRTGVSTLWCNFEILTPHEWKPEKTQ